MSHQEGFAAVLNPVCAPEAGEAARTCSGWSTALIPRQSFPCRLSFRFSPGRFSEQDIGDLRRWAAHEGFFFKFNLDAVDLKLHWIGRNQRGWEYAAIAARSRHAPPIAFVAPEGGRWKLRDWDRRLVGVFPSLAACLDAIRSAGPGRSSLGFHLRLAVKNPAPAARRGLSSLSGGVCQKRPGPLSPKTDPADACIRLDDASGALTKPRRSHPASSPCSPLA